MFEVIVISAILPAVNRIGDLNVTRVSRFPPDSASNIPASRIVMEFVPAYSARDIRICMRMVAPKASAVATVGRFPDEGATSRASAVSPSVSLREPVPIAACVKYLPPLVPTARAAITVTPFAVITIMIYYQRVLFICF